jgi:peptide/nickel transport system substrate-binding protein
MRQGRDGTAIRDQLAEAGVRVELVVRPWSEMYARLRSGEVAFYFGGVVAPTADASDVLDSFAHSRDPGRGYGTNNFLGYHNAALDLAIEGSSATLAQRQRRELLQRAIHLLAADLVYLPLYAPADFYGVRSDVDWEPRLNSFLLARDVHRRR